MKQTDYEKGFYNGEGYAISVQELYQSFDIAIDGLQRYVAVDEAEWTEYDTGFVDGYRKVMNYRFKFDDVILDNYRKSTIN